MGFAFSGLLASFLGGKIEDPKPDEDLNYLLTASIHNSFPQMDEFFFLVHLQKKNQYSHREDVRI